MRDLIARRASRALDESAATLERLRADEDLRDQLADSVTDIVAAIERANKILLAGNGGSAADAQHIAAEFVGRFRFDRSALPAIALTTDTSILTALGNDYGYDTIFARQIEALGQPGDIFIGYSTSGRSVNILAAFKAARRRGLITIGLTGSSETPMSEWLDHHLKAPSDQTARIQEAHLLIGHLICDLVEEIRFGKNQDRTRP